MSPTRMALTGGQTRWTFADLHHHVDAAGSALERQGVVAGERVGILAPNGPGFVVGVLALMRLGALVVPLNLRLTPAEIAWQRADAGVRLVLEATDLDALLAAERADTVPRLFDLDAPQAIIYTSGTTGRPKGAILTYGNQWWSAVASALNLGVRDDDHWLAVLPLFHVGGLSILMKSVIYGMRVSVHERFDPHVVNAAIDADGVTHVSVVSTMLDRMLTERGGRPYPPSLRCVLLGGGPVPVPLLERARAVGAPVVQTYGLSETASQIATLAPHDALRKVGSAGKPLMGAQVQVQADGEIWVQGPSVSPGYLNLPPRQGWLRTGDLGYLDDEGYLYVLDRRDDLIVSGGENVYPAEVESVLLSHPAVAEAGVFGTPDPTWGQTVVAAVHLRPDREASADEISAFCRERLAGYKVPRRFVFRGPMPRNAAGKLLRRALRDER